MKNSIGHIWSIYTILQTSLEKGVSPGEIAGINAQLHDLLDRPKSRAKNPPPIPDYISDLTQMSWLVRELLPASRVEIRSTGVIRKKTKVAIFGPDYSASVESISGHPQMILGMALVTALIAKARAEYEKAHPVSGEGDISFKTIREATSGQSFSDASHQTQNGDHVPGGRARTPLLPSGFKAPEVGTEARRAAGALPPKNLRRDIPSKPR